MRRVPARLGGWLHERIYVAVIKSYPLLSVPVTAFFLYSTVRADPAYELTWRKMLRLAFRMYRNTRRVFTGTSYRAHLAMAAKLLEIPPNVEGDVVECGCYLGGSTANLSLACELVGRDLIVYDSFEGLPASEPNDRYGGPPGGFRGDLDQVRDNVGRLGSLDRVSFRKGWFKDTLPAHDRPIVLCFLDVDRQASLLDCILNLWPRLTDQGYVFIDEYVLLDYCALFYSEKFWDRYFDRPPPGLLGAGSGVGLGQHYIGPMTDTNWFLAESIAYTRKDFRGDWTYYPDEAKTGATEAA